MFTETTALFTSLWRQVENSPKIMSPESRICLSLNIHINQAKSIVAEILYRLLELKPSKQASYIMKRAKPGNWWWKVLKRGDRALLHHSLLAGSRLTLGKIRGSLLEEYDRERHHGCIV